MIRVGGLTYQLVGFDTPETTDARASVSWPGGQWLGYAKLSAAALYSSGACPVPARKAQKERSAAISAACAALSRPLVAM
jgi:hypothetical protein